MDIDHLTSGIGGQIERMRVARAAIGGDIAWYPYDILGNVVHLDAMLSGAHRDLGGSRRGFR